MKKCETNWVGAAVKSIVKNCAAWAEPNGVCVGATKIELWKMSSISARRRVRCSIDEKKERNSLAAFHFIISSDKMKFATPTRTADNSHCCAEDGKNIFKLHRMAVWCYPVFVFSFFFHLLPKSDFPLILICKSIQSLISHPSFAHRDSCRLWTFFHPFHLSPSLQETNYSSRWKRWIFFLCLKIDLNPAEGRDFKKSTEKKRESVCVTCKFCILTSAN